MLAKTETVCLALLSSVWKFSTSQFSEAGAWQFGNVIALCLVQSSAKGPSSEGKPARKTSGQSSGLEGAKFI